MGILIIWTVWNNLFPKILNKKSILHFSFPFSGYALLWLVCLNKDISDPM